MGTILINRKDLTSWDYLHDHFSVLFGFPAWYGRNKDAWIDCMTFLDQKDENRASYNLAPESLILIEIFDVSDLDPAHYEVFRSLVDCASSVNYRRIELGLKPFLLLSYYNN